MSRLIDLVVGAILDILGKIEDARQWESRREAEQTERVKRAYPDGWPAPRSK